MLTSVLLSIIANISILSTASYIFVKLIPKKKVYTLTVKQQLLMIGFASLTSFLLMLFAVDLPKGAIIDLRQIILILLVYYVGQKVAIPTAILISLLRLTFGVDPASIRTAIMYIILGFLLPLVCRKLVKQFNNKYVVLLILNAICVVLIALNSYVLYDSFLVYILIYSIFLVLSSLVGILATVFIEDLLKSRSLYLNEKEHAKMDFLTGLYNMRAFNKKWRKIEGDQTIAKTALMMVDIDYFKWINDSYGHANGDFILRQVATILKVGAHDNELVYRVGGEEFCLILNDLSYAEQKNIADNIRSSVADKEFLLENGTRIKITVSIGLAASDQNKDMKKLYRLADRCLYMAKNQGRNKVMGEVMVDE
ncbi:GGDEF domain protein [Carnobacterium sp. AT7]|uniref:GGDEF domain-containing protein n=1 Tax=Carnobacterium sp. AT7 TaxID=333990 RepID=UPI00015F322E|nr:diguanylate cyclase [Carnobacterium sp. AT7]EDP69150.1 GGDEF domain protein [Carnobacterium sp. AT7]